MVPSAICRVFLCLKSRKSNVLGKHMKHSPYIFRHAFGSLTVFAPSPRAAIKKAKNIAGDFRVVPAFVQQQEATR